MYRILLRPLLGLTAKSAVIAAKLGNVDKLRRFVWLGDYHILRGENNRRDLTPLHWACAENHAPVVEFLLSRKINCDPNISRLNGFTPLHAAAAKGNSKICELLISSGANVNTQTTPQKYAPLHSAAFVGDIDTLKVLLKAGADKTLLNYRGEQPTDTAFRQGHLDVARIIAPILGSA